MTIVAVEMKGKAWDAREAAEQLNGGAVLAEQLTQPQSDNQRIQFLPLLMSTAVKHRFQLEILGQCRVKFQGKRYPIVQKRCGAALKDLLP